MNSTANQLLMGASLASGSIREAAGLRSKNVGDMSLDMFSLAEVDRALDRVASLWRYDWGYA